MKRLIGWTLIAVALAGCAPGPSSETTNPIKPQPEVTPAQKVHDELSSGAYQAEAALDTITNSLHSATDLKKSSHMHASAIQEAIDLIDSAGRGVADHTEEPPAVPEVESRFAEFDEKRLSAIEGCNDALHELREAAGLLDSLRPEVSSESISILDETVSFLTAAMDDVMGAIEGFGGKVEEESTL